MNGEIFTTEAGGGSYPEPPQETVRCVPECEECGETRDLFNVDGHTLCQHCKVEYFFRNAEYWDYMRFIRDSLSEQKDFFLTWFFENLQTLEKLEAVKTFFDRLSREEKEFHAKSYVSENKSDFADFMERVANRDV